MGIWESLLEKVTYEPRPEMSQANFRDKNIQGQGNRQRKCLLFQAMRKAVQLELR